MQYWGFWERRLCEFGLHDADDGVFLPFCVFEFIMHCINILFFIVV